MFYLQNASNGYSYNYPLWWQKGGNGYTDNIDKAEIFEEREADKIIKSTRGSHVFVKWPVDMIDKLAYRVVDIQDIRKVSND